MQQWLKSFEEVYIAETNQFTLVYGAAFPAYFFGIDGVYLIRKCLNQDQDRVFAFIQQVLQTYYVRYYFNRCLIKFDILDEPLQ